jgi:hypothetical protein
VKKFIFLFIHFILCFQYSQAEETSKGFVLPDYGSLTEASTENWLEITGVFGAITYLGAKEWEWGSSGFKFNK